MLQHGDTALCLAAARGKVEAVKALVDYGAAVDIRNEVYTCIVNFNIIVGADMSD